MGVQQRWSADNLLRAIESGSVISATHEAELHRAIDRLRVDGSDGELLSRMDGISCLLFQMNRFRREGRVNAYDSARLRLRKAASSL